MVSEGVDGWVGLLFRGVNPMGGEGIKQTHHHHTHTHHPPKHRHRHRHRHTHTHIQAQREKHSPPQQRHDVPLPLQLRPQPAVCRLDDGRHLLARLHLCVVVRGLGVVGREGVNRQASVVEDCVGVGLVVRDGRGWGGGGTC